MRNETTNLPLLKDLDEIKARMAEVDAMYDAARYQIRMSLDVMDPVDREATLDQHQYSAASAPAPAAANT